MSAACLTACSDDDDNPIPQVPHRSMITEFVTPTSVYHEQSAFNAEFVANEDSSKIVGVRCLDFDITLAGTNIDFSTDPGLFVQELEEYGDTAAAADIPAAAYSYRPSTKPIRTITITNGNETRTSPTSSKCRTCPTTTSSKTAIPGTASQTRVPSIG